MAKITQLTIVDENTLRLEVDAQKGDEIDLLSLNEFDTSNIRKLIEEGKEKEYNKKLEEERKKFKLELESEIFKTKTNSKEEYNEIIEKYKMEILSLKNENKNLVSSIEEKSNLKASEEIKKYLEIINKLEKDKNDLKYQYDKKIFELEYAFKDAKNNVEILINEKDNELKDKIHKLEIEYKEQIHEKENEIVRLQNERTILNSKHIGDDLERWCNNEFLSHSQTGFINCTWEKDTKAIKNEGEVKGTKADYIFRVFSDESHQVELTSVACEMKTEDPLSKTTKTNDSHYAKLDKDRIKKNCEYALLISELEIENISLPIMKVNGYDKMYMVRPQYFIAVLSIIESLANKYKELIIQKDKEEVKFEKTNIILEKFEKFKDDIINTLLERIIKSANEINKQAKNINQAANSILELSAKIIDTQVEAIKNKVEKFDITKLNKSIDKLDK